MEYVEGKTLREILTERGKLPTDEASRIIEGVLDALAYSHRMGIVHRDIKPANVMVGQDGAIKVMDFGIARAIADTAATMTQTQAVIGTAQYLSPEQAQGQNVDARSDLYSTGCLLFELLTGPAALRRRQPRLRRLPARRRAAASRRPRARRASARTSTRIVAALPGQGPREALPGRDRVPHRPAGRPSRPPDQRGRRGIARRARRGRDDRDRHVRTDRGVCRDHPSPGRLTSRARRGFHDLDVPGCGGATRAARTRGRRQDPDRDRRGCRAGRCSGSVSQQYRLMQQDGSKVSVPVLVNIPPRHRGQEAQRRRAGLHRDDGSGRHRPRGLRRLAGPFPRHARRPRHHEGQARDLVRAQRRAGPRPQGHDRGRGDGGAREGEARRRAHGQGRRPTSSPRTGSSPATPRSARRCRPARSSTSTSPPVRWCPQAHRHDAGRGVGRAEQDRALPQDRDEQTTRAKEGTVIAQKPDEKEKVDVGSDVTIVVAQKAPPPRRRSPRRPSETPTSSPSPSGRRRPRPTGRPRPHPPPDPTQRRATPGPTQRRVRARQAPARECLQWAGRQPRRPWRRRPRRRGPAGQPHRARHRLVVAAHSSQLASRRWPPCGEHGLGVELHPVQRQRRVLHRHDDAALGLPGGDQLVGHRVGLDRRASGSAWP